MASMMATTTNGGVGSPIVKATPPLLPQAARSNGRWGSFGIPSFSTPSVTRLLQYRVEGDGGPEDNPKTSEKEVKSLVKKVRKKEILQELEKALSSGGEVASACVTLPRLLDGKDGSQR